MRRVNIRNGIKQRMTEILGTDVTANVNPGVTDPGITPWSIQSAMLTNFQTVGKAIVGSASYGRVMDGLSLSGDLDATSFGISSGIGFTNNGDAIYLKKNITVPIDASITGNAYIFLQYKISILAESGDNGGKNSQFIGSSSQEIVYDEFASTDPADPTSIVIQQNSPVPPSPISNYIYLGYVPTSGGGSITGPSVQTNFVGIPPVGGGVDFTITVADINSVHHILTFSHGILISAT